METGFDGKIAYRDYVVHFFTGVLFNFFLLLVFYPIYGIPKIFTEDIPNELIVSIIAIPILFLEGHFLSAIDRLLFMELPSWIYEKNNTISSAEGKLFRRSFKDARKKWYKKCPVFFIILFGKRITGQKTIREIKNEEELVINKNEENKVLVQRYYVLSDFFKGVGCAAWIAFIIAVVQLFRFATLLSWVILGILLMVILLSWFRCRFYSKLYVRYYYKKNQ